MEKKHVLVEELMLGNILLCNIDLETGEKTDDMYKVEVYEIYLGNRTLWVQPIGEYADWSGFDVSEENLFPLFLKDVPTWKEDIISIYGQELWDMLFKSTNVSKEEIEKELLYFHFFQNGFNLNRFFKRYAESRESQSGS